MVGKKSGLIPLREVSKAAAGMMEAPYRLGSFDPEEGLDCISSIMVFYRKLGAEIPEEFEGLNPGNYAAAWRKDPEGVKKIMARYLLSLGESVDPNFKQAGDLIFFDQDGETAVAIFLGNGNILASDYRIGTRVFPVRGIKGKIKRVQRLCRKP